MSNEYMHTKEKKARPGGLLVDIILSMAIFGLIVAAFSSGIGAGQTGTKRSSERLRAIYLAEEGIEVVRALRDEQCGYDVLTSDPGSYLSFETGRKWEFSSTNTPIDSIFTRTITIESISTNVQKVTSTVYWVEQPTERPVQVALESYVTNWRVGPPPSVPDWSTPTISGSLAISGASLQKIAVSGDYAYVANNVVAGSGLLIMDISNPATPTLAHSISLAGSKDVAVRGNYAYMATGDASNEIKVIDISDPLSATCCAGQINLTGGAIVNGLATYGTGLFIARTASTAPEFYVYDVGDSATNPTLIATIETSIDGSRSAYAITATGSSSNPYVYVGTDHIVQELTVASGSGDDITGGAGIGSAQNTAYAVEVVGNSAFLGVQGSSACEIAAFNIQNKIANPNRSDDCGGTTSYNLGGDSDASEVVHDMAVMNITTPCATLTGATYLFAAAHSVRGSTDYFLHILDVADVNDINSSNKRLYDGAILDGYDANQGIYYHYDDHLLFMVGGEDFLILEPS